MGKLVIIQTIVPDYRKKFFLHIKKQLKNEFLLFSGDSYFEKSVKSDNSMNFSIKIRNHFFLGRKLLFQSGIWHLVFKDIVLILELNPRIISNWIILLMRKIAGKKTILWGHAWSRKGPNSNTEWFRNFMRANATSIIVYTESQKKELQKRMPSKKIYAAPNAILETSKMKVSNIKEDPINIIYVGRLTSKKKPLFLAQAFEKAISKIPNKVKLYIVGEGEEREKVSVFVKTNNLEEKIIIKGHMSKYDQLRELYDKSFISISPGYVGLSIIQSFGFGVPMLISKNEDHSPEIEAVILEKNALFYETDNYSSFIEVLQKAYTDKEYWKLQRPNIVSYCKEKYSVESMAKVFIELNLKSES